jgi:outer membrane murein-binding lipoprotein Lpp
MIIVLSILAAVYVAAAYVAYREYKSGKLTSLVTAFETRISALEAIVKSDATKVVAAVETEAKKL